MTTISASSTIGVVLSSPSYVNPVVNAATIDIAVGIALTGVGAVWTITNQQTIESTDTSMLSGSPGGVQSAGIYPEEGGSITNESNGTISGFDGIYSNFATDIVNAGRIAGNLPNVGGAYFSAGVYENSGGGTVTNLSTGTITGAEGVFGGGGSGCYVDNAGVITGNLTFGEGVRLWLGGTVINRSSGTIGAWIGVSGKVNKPAVTVENAGSITGSGQGVDLGGGGSVTNATSASIAGVYNGVHISDGAGVVSNYGSITDMSGTGVRLDAGGSVSNAASASITGDVGVFLFDGGTLLNAGSIIGNAGTAVAFGGTGGNLLVLEPTYAFSGLVTGSTSASNTLELASAASLGTVSGLGSEFTNFGPINFAAGAQWNIAGDTSGLGGTISGFAPGDTIEVTGVTATGSSFSGSILTIDETGGGTVTLDLPGTFTATSFNVTNNTIGTEVTLVVPCFCAATRIACIDGERAVETLTVGDFVRVASGECAKVTWTGHRHVDCRHHPHLQQMWPVRVRANAFAGKTPHRDLLLSPDHAVFIDGVLIPIRYLINGSTIVQEPVHEVTYFHVELASHDVIFAEGLACESYLDTGNRAAFADDDGQGSDHPHRRNKPSYAPSKSSI